MRSFTAIRKEAGLFCGSRLRKDEGFAYVGLPQNLKDLKDLTETQIPHLIRITLQTLAASRLHWRAGSSRSFTAIRKNAGLFCGSSLRKGEVFAFVENIQNLKDLKG